MVSYSLGGKELEVLSEEDRTIVEALAQNCENDDKAFRALHNLLVEKLGEDMVKELEGLDKERLLAAYLDHLIIGITVGDITKAELLTLGGNSGKS